MNVVTVAQLYQWLADDGRSIDRNALAAVMGSMSRAGLPQVIHHTRGVYANGEYKDNGVQSDRLVAHIHYNLLFRPGRAFFVDGRCLNIGYLSDERIAEAIKAIDGKKMARDTAPYQ